MWIRPSGLCDGPISGAEIIELTGSSNTDAPRSASSALASVLRIAFPSVITRWATDWLIGPSVSDSFPSPRSSLTARGVKRPSGLGQQNISTIGLRKDLEQRVENIFQKHIDGQRLAQIPSDFQHGPQFDLCADVEPGFVAGIERIDDRRRPQGGERFFAGAGGLAAGDWPRASVGTAPAWNSSSTSNSRI